MSKSRIYSFIGRYVTACVAFLLCLVIIYHVMSGLDLPHDTIVSGKADGQVQNYPTVILDAGHGGEDCGAVGISGVYEKDLNMRITACLASYLRLAGCRVVLTRTEDRLLYDPATVQKGHKKMEDLANRSAIAASYDHSVMVSIHMNSFPSESVHGLQVWYSGKSDNSKRLAAMIQDDIKEYLQADNHRKPKESAGNIYLLDYAEHPAVLVECGFVTNVAECAKLSDEAYQKELSFVLFCAMMEYINETV